MIQSILYRILSLIKLPPWTPWLISRNTIELENNFILKVLYIFCIDKTYKSSNYLPKLNLNVCCDK